MGCDLGHYDHLLAVCVAYVAVTVVSYLLIKKEKYKADAWAKIVLFGITLLGLLIIIGSSGIELISLILLTGIPILLSVMVLVMEQINKVTEKSGRKNFLLDFFYTRRNFNDFPDFK